PLPVGCTYEQYEDLYDEALVAAREQDGVEVAAFGDLFLEEVRAYRMRQAARAGLEPCFPLFGSDTHALAREMIDAGTRAHLTCVQPELCPAEFVGRVWDHTLLRELPASVDPCGERGEFHTFVSAGPALHESLAVQVGEVVERDGVVFADLIESSREDA
ncbi:MAG: ATP-binding protein, partial [Planctomycetota bacterium]